MAGALIAAVFSLFYWDSEAVSLDQDFVPLMFLGACGGAVLGAVWGGAWSRSEDRARCRIVGTGVLVALGPFLGALAGSAEDRVFRLDGAFVGAAVVGLVVLRRKGAFARLFGASLGALAGFLAGIAVESCYRPSEEQFRAIGQWSQWAGSGAGAFLGAIILLRGRLRWAALFGAVAGGFGLALAAGELAAWWWAPGTEQTALGLANTMVLAGAWAGASLGSMFGAALIRSLFPGKT
jgi:hypothetical protein